MTKKQTLAGEQPATETSIDFNQAWKEAHVTARRARRLSKHVISMIEAGETADKAKMGHFPNRYPSNNVDRDSVTMATNAELREAGHDVTVALKDVTVDTYDSRVGISPPKHELDVIVKTIDGDVQPTSDRYSMHATPDQPHIQQI